MQGHTWRSVGGNAVTFFQWNKGLGKWNMTKYFLVNSTIISGVVVEPANFYNCTYMLYSDHREPFWATVPCDSPLAKNWICENPTLGGIDSSPSVEEFWCVLGANSVGHKQCARYQSLHIDAIINIFNPSELVYNEFIKRKFMWLTNNTKEAYLALHLTDWNPLSTSTQKCVLYHWNATGRFTCKYPISTTMLCPTSTNVNFFVDSPINSMGTCRPGHTKCLDNTCALDTYACMHDGCNPELCNCTLRSSGKKVNDAAFCANQCSPLICSCSPLFFQCSSGGCISLSKFMNGIPDCRDASDEIDSIYVEEQDTLEMRDDLDNDEKAFFACNSGYRLPLYNVDDLIPDCPGDESEDEPTYWSLMENLNIAPSPCLDQGLISCLQGHIKCIRFDQLCVYDLDSYGQIKYCRDASHLQGCSTESCSNTYKCRSSYCIPYHRVCDGQVDCPQRDDESSCSAYKCPGMLRCYGSFQCVHPIQICDEEAHCPHGDDEELCDIKPCPEGCHCLAHAVWCHEGKHSYKPTIATKNTVAVTVNGRFITKLDISNITSVSNLRILDVARKHILDICTYLRKSLLFYRSIVILNLSDNNINYLDKNCFLFMPGLVTLDLHDNPLHHLEELSFNGLKCLKILNLMNTQLIEIHSSQIYGTENIIWLNLAGCPLIYLDVGAVQMISFINHVIFNDHNLCCAAPEIKQCVDLRIMHCPRLLEYGWLTYIIASLAILAVVFNILALVYQQITLLSISSVIRELNIITLINNMFQALVILIICIADIFYGKSFALSMSHWRQSKTNIYVGVTLLCTTLMSMMLQNVNIYILYRLATSMAWKLQEFALKLRVWIASYLMVTIIVSIMLAMGPLAHATENSDLGITFAKMNYHSVYDILGVFGFIALNTISVLFIILLSLLMLHHIDHTERSVTRLVDEHVTDAIKNMHRHRREKIRRCLMIILFIKFLSWLPTSSIMLSIYMNTTPPKPLLITIFCLLMPVSMFLYPILAISHKR